VKATNISKNLRRL